MNSSIGRQHSPAEPNRGVARNKKTRVNIAADFETTTAAMDPNSSRVWAWGLAEIDTIESPDDVVVGTSIESFFEYLRGGNYTAYFHNLKFDGSFILSWLLMNGYEWVDGKGGIQPKTFQTLISSQNRFYTITVRWENGSNVEFRDSANKIPMPLARVAKTFKMDVLKGSIDYDAFRPVGHQLTEQEDEYLRHDVYIVANAMRQVLESGMTKLTVASDSMKEYKTLVSSKVFNRTFPGLSPAMDKEIRRAYEGGWTYADPRFRGRIVRSGLTVDVNSLYPSVMRNRLIPYGEPEFVNGKVEPTERRPLTIFTVTILAKLKPNHVPCIREKAGGIFHSATWHTAITEPKTITVTNVDWALYNEQYDITVLEWGHGWRFHAAEGMFDKYIDKWAEVKATSEGGRKEIAKLHLNSLYGKFASNPDVTGKVPVLDEHGILHFVKGEEEQRAPVYTAAGVFITSWARDLTIRAAQANYDVFAYADTDSLHLLTDDVPTDLDIHPSRMGAWKLEYHFEEAFYVRAKAYMERLADGTYVNRFAGLPIEVSEKLTFADMVHGKQITGKLRHTRVRGGVVLLPTTFPINLH